VTDTRGRSRQSQRGGSDVQKIVLTNGAIVEEVNRARQSLRKLRPQCGSIILVPLSILLSQNFIRKRERSHDKRQILPDAGNIPAAPTGHAAALHRSTVVKQTVYHCLLLHWTCPSASDADSVPTFLMAFPPDVSADASLTLLLTFLLTLCPRS
jgi:hypothetical protein